jgi:uncharacterized membrane protein YgcG
MLGVVSPFGTDGTANEGRSYSAGSLFDFDAGNALYNAIVAQISFPEANLNKNPYWSASASWWDAIEPVDLTQGHEAWGDSGNGSATDWYYMYFGRDLSYFLNNQAAYQHWVNENNVVVAGNHSTSLSGEPYYEQPVPKYFSQPSAADSPALEQFYPQGGWAVGCSQPQNTANCFDNGVGYAFNARPGGNGIAHGHYSDMSYQLWAYGNPITDQSSEYNIDQFQDVPMSQQTMLVNGLGPAGPCQNGNDGLYSTTPYETRLFAFATTSDYAYAAADGTNEYPTANLTCSDGINDQFKPTYSGGPLSTVGLQKVRRHILFVRNKYFVIYDDYASSQPAQFTSLYHVLEDTLSLNGASNSFTYTSNVDQLLEAIPSLRSTVVNLSAPTVTTTVYVQEVSSSTIAIADQTGSNARANPIIPSETYTSTASQELLPQAHVLWVSNAAPSQAFHLITVVFPAKAGAPAPTITRVDGDTVSVTDNAAATTDVISFDADTASANNATMLVDLSQLAPTSVTDDVWNGTTTVASFTAPTNGTGYAPELAVVATGTGSGVVTSSDAAISCGLACTDTLASSASVTLTATANSGSTFAGWGGGICSGTAPCTLTVSSYQYVTAEFDAASSGGSGGTSGNNGGSGGSSGSYSSGGGGGGVGYTAPLATTTVATTTLPTIPGCPKGFTCVPKPVPNCPKGFTCTPSAAPVCPKGFTCAPAAIAPTARVSTQVLFTRSLTLGSTGSDVKALQRFLNSHGFTVSQSGNGSPGHESTYYGPATASAVSRFQEYYAPQILAPYGLSKGTGYFGTATMKEVNALERE